MKLSYRDKVIFLVAIVIIIGVAGVFLFIKPKFEEMNAAKAVLDQKKAEKAGVEAKINTYPEIVAMLKATADEVEKLQEPFLPDQDPYLNEQLVYQYLTDNGIDPKSMSTTYTVGLPATEYMVNPKNVHSYDLLMQSDIYPDDLPQEVRDNYNKVPFPVGSGIVIGTTSVNVTFVDERDSDENLFKFIDYIHNLKTGNNTDKEVQTLYIPTFSADHDKTQNVLNGSVNLTLYSLNPLNVEEIRKEPDEFIYQPEAAPAE